MNASRRRTVSSPSDRRFQLLGGWLKANAHTLLLVGILVGGWIANFATVTARTSDVEKAEAKLEQRFDHEVVPRQEQEVRDRMLDQRLEQMQRSLDSIQQQLQRQSR